MLKYLLFLLPPLVAGVLRLRELSYLKVPNVNNGATNPFLGTVDKIAFDQSEAYLYVIGGRTEGLKIYDVLDPTQPIEVHSQIFNEVNDGIPVAIDVCKSSNVHQVVIAFAANTRLHEGHIEIFTALNRLEGRDFSYLSTTDTEFDPVAVTYDRTCRKIVVACEGLPAESGGNFVDPYGHVNILERNVDAWDHQTINFVGVGGDPNSVRYIYKHGSGHTLQNDLEPSDVVIDENDMVYVAFHENNAIARFNLYDNTNIVIYSAGEKDWNLHDIDSSDSDQTVHPDKVNLVRRNIKSHLQPKTISTVTYKGHVYLATANTGGIKNYVSGTDGVSFTDGTRGRLLDTSKFNSGIDSALRTELRANTDLGRIFISTLEDVTDGWNAISTGFDELYTFGGRSWSLLNASGTFSSIYESGSDFEYHQSQNSRSIFNTDCIRSSDTPLNQLDTRSDDHGPEPRSVDTTVFGTRTVVAAGSGRMGALYLYELTDPVGTGIPKPVFQSYNRFGGTLTSWSSLYDGNNTGTPYIGQVKFGDVGSHKLLFVAGVQMGVVHILELYDSATQ